MNFIILTDIYSNQEVTINVAAIVMMRRFDADQYIAGRTCINLHGDCNAFVHETPDKIRQLIRNYCGEVEVQLPLGGGVPSMHNPRRDDIGKYTEQ